MNNNENEFIFNFSKFEFLTMHIGQSEKFLAACSTEDDIGVVLRLHLLLEKDLETWCICATGNNKMFNGFGENLSFDFAAKAQLANNFGLSQELYKVVKRFNKIRNSRAHQVENFSITEPEISSLTNLISKNYPANLSPIDEFEAKIYDQPLYRFSDKDTPYRVKFIMLFSMLKMRMCDEALRQIGKQL